MSHVFGPVPSRRLGRSLGIDLTPFKTCSYDCIYCQLGRTTNKTVERRRWTPVADLLAEVKEKLALKPDYITLSGSGEPTLSADLGDLIEGVRSLTPAPVAVLTNGSLLWRRDVREELAMADLVVPSLDAGDAAIFEAVNRPHGEITFARMAEGLVLFRDGFQGEIWLEVMVLEGYTADRSEIQAIAGWASRMRPNRVQLNTVTRPPAESFAWAAGRAKLNDLASYFEPPAEVIAEFQGVQTQEDFAATRDAVLQLIERRPCALDDVAQGLGMHRNEAVKYVEELASAGRIHPVKVGGRVFYALTRPAAASEGAET